MKFKFLFPIFLLILLFNSTNPFFIKNKTKYDVGFILEETPKVCPKNRHLNAIEFLKINALKNKTILPGNIAEISLPDNPKEDKDYFFQFYVQTEDEDIYGFTLPDEYSNLLADELKKLKFSIIDSTDIKKYNIEKTEKIAASINAQQFGLPPALHKIIAEYAVEPTQESKDPFFIIEDDYKIGIK